MTSRPCDKSGIIIFNAYRQPGDAEIQATDAKLIGQIDSTYISATNRGAYSSNELSDQKLVITTPNANYLPSVHVGNQIVSLRTDGRWGTNDWSQWPQWYFAERDHFAYILRKPPLLALENHPLRLLWWKMEPHHFISDDGLNAGLLMSTITDGFYDIRIQLMKEVRACVCPEGHIYQLLQSAAAKMRAYTSALRFTPQPLTSVLQTVAAAQRYCLETRAILDKVNKWDKMKTIAEQRPTDQTIMGCVTDSIPITYLMHEKGVPIWFVRSLSQLTDDVNIIEQRNVTRPAHVGIETKRLIEGCNIYCGPISPVIFNAIENWKPGVLDFRLLGKGIPQETDHSTSAENPNHVKSSRLTVPLPPTESSRPTVPLPPTKTSRRIERLPSTGDSHRVESTRPAMGGGGSSMVRKSATPYSTSGRLFQGTGPTMSVNLDRFKPSNSPNMPALLDAWRNALTAVNADLALIVDHPNLHIFHGFAFPPSHIFCGESESGNVERMLAWVVIRTGWMGTFADPSHRDIPLPNAQNWRTYLFDVASELGFTCNKSRPAPNPTSTMQAMRKKSRPASATSAARSGKMREVQKKIFTLQIPQKEVLHSLSWQGHIVWRPGHIDFPLSHRKTLMWDIQEHGFRLELLSLDRCLLPTVWSVDEEATIRDQKFSALWPNDVILMEQLPNSTSGISAEDWQERAPFIEAFRQIVMDWPGEIPQQLSDLSFSFTANGGLVWNRAGMERVEALAAQHFCQTFFNYFGRAPCIPHIFPVG